MQHVQDTFPSVLQSDTKTDRSSSLRAQTWGGTAIPPNSFDSSRKDSRLSSSPSWAGISPVSSLSWRCKPFSRKQPPNSVGIVPENVLLCSSNVVMSSSFPKRVGIVPLNWLSFKVIVTTSVKRPSPAGMAPLSLLESRFKIPVGTRCQNEISVTTGTD